MNIATSVNTLEQRSSGILLPIFSLPGQYGIGDLGPAADRFIAFLRAAGQSCWQILPCGPTNRIFGNSPYMSSSAFAGSPLLIALEPLLEQKLLREDEIGSPEFSQYTVDYPKVEAFKSELLKKAWNRYQARSETSSRLQTFTEEYPWALHYAQFMVLKGRYRGAPWYAWPQGARKRQAKALDRISREDEQELGYHLFTQMLFLEQWQRMRAVAHAENIRLIGDLPIYVAHDSVDVWCHQSLFDLDATTGEPRHVAGVPPDYFSALGQRWGNPLYRWSSDIPEIKDSLWTWWEQRLRCNFAMVDILRLDHFRGFAAYWSVPAEEKTAVNGIWEPGPGLPFFSEMERRVGPMPIIAEDLGTITPDVEELRLTLGYPGMKVLLFAFDGDPRNLYLPFNCDRQSVLYTGTHDNDTAVGWFLNPLVSQDNKRLAKRYVNRDDDHAGSFHQELIHLALGSVANLVILPMQDVLGFGNDCRLNIPGTTENNWQWRCSDRSITPEVAGWLHSYTALFGRLPTQDNEPGKEIDLAPDA